MAYLVSDALASGLIEVQHEMEIGRDPSCAIVLTDSMVSRHHLRILETTDGKFVLEDLGSTHGSYVDGRRCGRLQLRDGAEIRAGATVLRFKMNKPEAPGAVPSTDRFEVEVERPRFLPESSVVDGADLRREYERLRATYELTQAIGTETGTTEVMDKVLDCAFKLMSADRGLIALLDEQGEVRVQHARDRNGEPCEASIPRVLLDDVIDKRCAILTADAACDLRFSRSESVHADRIRSAMTVPLLWESEVLGVLQVDTQNATNVFGPGDLELFGTLASHAALALQNVVLQEKLRERERGEKDRLQAVLDALPVGVLLLADNGEPKGANPEARRLFPELGRDGTLGGPVHEIGGRGVQEIVDQSVHAPFDVELGAPPVIAMVTGVAREQPAAHEDDWSVVLSIQEVTERRLQEARARAAIAARLEAEAASEAKSRFLANMSHEIRTPLNAVIGMSELALELQATDEMHTSLETIASSAHQLLRMVDDILDLSKIEADRLEVERVEVDLPNLLDDVLPIFAAQFRNKGLAFEATVAPDVPRTCTSDPKRIEQVLTNLIGNAAKFTEAGGVVLSLTRVRDTILRLSVCDTGIGMSAAQLERVFEPFLQADLSTTRRYGGTGLGLSISRRLAGLLGGRLWAKSAPDEGSTFHLDLPLRVNDAPQRDALRDHRVLVAGPRGVWVDDLCAKVEGLGGRPDRLEDRDALLTRARADAPDLIFVAREYARAPGMGLELAEAAPHAARVLLLPVAESASAHLAAGRGFHRLLSSPLFTDEIADATDVSTRDEVEVGTTADIPALDVLVAEDNPVNQRVIQALLERMGHQVTMVADGQAAVEAATDRQFALVLMDLHMPKLDGLDATRAIRAIDGPAAATPVVALTACATTEDARRCEAAGMDDYLAKPVRTARLRNVLAEAARRRSPAPA